MTDDTLRLSHVRKSERAMRSARLSLQSSDPDSAVNRAYYAMFNISRAALLASGVSEGDLPRTHRGINEAFRQHAVLTGRIEPELAGSLNKAENLRLMADYTAKEIDRHEAAEIVDKADTYVRTVERVFDLGQSQGRESSASEQQPSEGKTAETPEETRQRAAEEWSKQRQAKRESQSLEQTQAKARENWLKFRQQKSEGKTADKEHTPGRDVGTGIEDDSEQ